MKNFSYFSVFLFFISLRALSQTPMSIENLPDLQNARAGHVLIVPSANNYLVVGGHINGFNLSKKAELLETSSKEWSTLNSVDNRDMSFVAKLNNNSYLIGGGCSSALGVGQLKTTEIYNPTTNTFSAGGSMAVARTIVTSGTLTDGRVLVVGNWYASAEKAEIYDPVSNSFSSTGVCLIERSSPVIVPTNNGGAIVCGGIGTHGAVHAQHIFEKYDPISNTFSELRNTLFNGETSWGISGGNNFMPHHFLLPDGKYAVLVYTNLNKRVRIITIDPATSEIAELKTTADIPLLDENNPDINFGCYASPMVDAKNNLLHIVQQAPHNSKYILRIVTINLVDGSVNSSSMDGFTFPVASAALTMLDNGRILFTGGMKPNNFTVSAQAFIIQPATYSTSKLTSANATTLKAYWNAQNNNFALNETVKSATLYDLHGRLLHTTYNSRFIEGSSTQTGIYFIRAEGATGTHSLLKVLRP